MFHRKQRDRQSDPTKDQKPFFAAKPSTEMSIQKQEEDKVQKTVSPHSVYHPKRFTPTQLLGDRPPKDRGQKAEQIRCKINPALAEMLTEDVNRTPVQAKSVADREVSESVEHSIQRARGGGQPLRDDIRQPMERAMGADFSRVRIHNNNQSDRLSNSIQAKAFTTGRDIFFKQGEYSPNSRGGQELLAHELTHVVQQNSDVSLQRKEISITGNVSNPTIQRATLLDFLGGSKVSFFYAFAQRDYSEESLDYLFEIKKFNEKPTLSKARKLWEKFKDAVNINDEARVEIINDLKNAEGDDDVLGIFGTFYKDFLSDSNRLDEIYRTLTDTFRRFKNSEEYNRAIGESGNVLGEGIPKRGY